ncbi:MAG: heme exporter protein CcmB [Phototrophicaceae bacterium]|jgi:heme exporter protein B
MRTPFWQVLSAVFRKDLLTERRGRELLSAMGLFALLSVLVFSFALQLDLTSRREAVAGILWVTVTFAVIIGFSRGSATERENGSFEAILIAPIPRTALYLGKFLANALFAALVGSILLPLMNVLYNVRLVNTGAWGVLLLGVIGLAATGTLLATMTVQTRSRETLLPIVMLPVTLPLLLAAVTATNAIITNSPTSDWVGWLGLLAALDGMYIALGVLLFDYVIEG